MQGGTVGPARLHLPRYNFGKVNPLLRLGKDPAHNLPVLEVKALGKTT
jgi:hypothetical protein